MLVPILPLFPVAMWAVCRNSHYITFVWESRVGMSFGGVHHLGYFVPDGEHLFLGKTPSFFVYFCY